MVKNGNDWHHFEGKNGGRWGTRTLDPYRVKVVL